MLKMLLKKQLTILLEEPLILLLLLTFQLQQQLLDNGVKLELLSVVVLLEKVVLLLHMLNLLLLDLPINNSDLVYSLISVTVVLQSLSLEVLSVVKFVSNLTVKTLSKQFL